MAAVWTILPSAPFQLLALGVVAVLVRRFLLRPGSSPTASGAMVMAGGIFALNALQRLPVGDHALLTRIVALGLLTVSSCIGASYLASWLHGTLSRHVTDPVNRFAVGTWVAGTSVLAQTIVLALPAWRPLALVLALAAATLWLWFLTLALPGFRAIAADPAREHAKGRILLSTVSTQAVILLAVVLFPGEIPRWTAAAMIALGCLFYVIGMGLITARYLGQVGWRLADDWDNTNCIVHGAVSITGLALVASGALATEWVIAFWLWAAAMFLVVESIELVRAYCRVQCYGWRRGLFTYHVSQWARNFTFGMFYAFTLHLHIANAGAGGLPQLAAVWTFVAHYGQYLVLFLLLAETALLIDSNVDIPIRRGALRPTGLASTGTFGFDSRGDQR